MGYIIFQAQASLNSGVNLRQVVKLPKDEDFNDWLAVHVVDFFNRINLIYGTVCEKCTDTSCPTMSGGPKFEYLWQDGKEFKRPTKLPANKVKNNRNFIFKCYHTDIFDRAF